MYKEHLDRIVTYFNDRHPKALAAARQEFFELTGEIYEDDPFYEERVANYLEWFLFDRPFDERGRAIDYYERTVGRALSEEDRETIDSFCRPVHSLFEVRRLRPGKHLVVLLDLADRAKYEVTERRSLVGLNKGAVFETRLIRKNETVFFMPAFVHHPPETAAFIRGKMKEMRRAGVEDFRPFMMTLQKIWMRRLRYGHVSAQRIYTEEMLEKLHVGHLP